MAEYKLIGNTRPYTLVCPNGEKIEINKDFDKIHWELRNKGFHEDRRIVDRYSSETTHIYSNESCLSLELDFE